jgi:hypothetical protein
MSKPSQDRPENLDVPNGPCRAVIEGLSAVP